MQVTLLSADCQKFEVDVEVAKMSHTVKDMIDGELHSKICQAPAVTPRRGAASLK